MEFGHIEIVYMQFYPHFISKSYDRNGKIYFIFRYDCNYCCQYVLVTCTKFYL
jgi:hypothetical protein